MKAMSSHNPRSKHQNCSLDDTVCWGFDLERTPLRLHPHTSEHREQGSEVTEKPCLEGKGEVGDEGSFHPGPATQIVHIAAEFSPATQLSG